MKDNAKRYEEILKAWQKGGLTTKKRYGVNYLRELGKKGGLAKSKNKTK